MLCVARRICLRWYFLPGCAVLSSEGRRSISIRVVHRPSGISQMRLIFRIIRDYHDKGGRQVLPLSLRRLPAVWREQRAFEAYRSPSKGQLQSFLFGLCGNQSVSLVRLRVCWEKSRRTHISTSGLARACYVEGSGDSPHLFAQLRASRDPGPECPFTYE